MKKENRKIAQQRRAQERKKQEKIRKLKSSWPGLFPASSFCFLSLFWWQMQ